MISRMDAHRRRALSLPTPPDEPVQTANPFGAGLADWWAAFWAGRPTTPYPHGLSTWTPDPNAAPREER